MAISKAIAASGLNLSAAIQKVGLGSASYLDRGGNDAIPTGALENYFTPHDTSWALGTGVWINSTGTILFDARTHGGALSEVVLINRGSANSGTVYLGFNQREIVLASGIQLAMDESIEVEEEVTRIWAVCAAGTGVARVAGGGLFARNPCTI